MVDRFVERVGAHADRCPAEVVLADVHRVEGAVPSVVAPCDDVFLGDRIVLECILRHVVLTRADVLHELVLLVLRVCAEEHVLTGVRELAKGRDDGGLVPVADVVLTPARGVGAVSLRREHHVARVHVRAVLLFREAKREDRSLVQGLRRALLDRLVLAHPERSEPEHGNLPGVPVLKSIEAQDLRELADSPGVPARVRGALSRRRRHGREELLLFDVVEEVGVPNLRVIVVFDPPFTLAFEEFDRLEHHLAGSLVGVGPRVLLGIE